VSGILFVVLLVFGLESLYGFVRSRRGGRPIARVGTANYRLTISATALVAGLVLLVAFAVLGLSGTLYIAMLLLVIGGLYELLRRISR
jgi:hypothetical protein